MVVALHRKFIYCPNSDFRLFETFYAYKHVWSKINLFGCYASLPPPLSLIKMCIEFFSPFRYTVNMFSTDFDWNLAGPTLLQTAQMVMLSRSVRIGWTSSLFSDNSVVLDRIQKNGGCIEVFLNLRMSKVWVMNIYGKWRSWKKKSDAPRGRVETFLIST
jgi:hypothetical protein